MKLLKLEEIPDLQSCKYPERQSVALSAKAKERLGLLKTQHKKNPSEFMRLLIERNLDEIFGKSS
jgi:predicted DNA-binding protein